MHANRRLGVGGAIYFHAVGHTQLVEGGFILEAPVNEMRMYVSLSFVNDLICEVLDARPDSCVAKGVGYDTS